MAPVELPCPANDCEFKTIKLEFAHAKELLDIHVKVDHPVAAVGGESQRKPEKFPRPEISLDKSAEEWSEFKVSLFTEFSVIDSGSVSVSSVSAGA